MVRSSADMTLKRAQTFMKRGDAYKSLELFQSVLERYPGNKKALQGITATRTAIISSGKKPSPTVIAELHKLIAVRKYSVALDQAEALVLHFPHAPDLWRVIGITSHRVGNVDRAISAYKHAILICPDMHEDYFALSILQEEIGQLDSAEASLRRAIALKPGFYQAYTNLGTILQKQGARRAEAIEAYRMAISIEPQDALAHQYLSELVTYKLDDAQIAQVEGLLEETGRDDLQLCHLHHAMAKMKEDIGCLDEAVAHYKAAGRLRQKSLNYRFEQDQALFSVIRHVAPTIKAQTLNGSTPKSKPCPIFILGMPRSGTSLVEQIISSHSQIHGAGELRLLGKYGRNLSLGKQAANSASLEQFRSAYLSNLASVSNGKSFVADKLPQNFLQVGLICSAFPDAKIIHTMRDPAATCWSNFKINFQGPYLGYSHDLTSVVQYYKLYQQLMAFWHELFPERIYDLNYEQLTINQEDETRKLIDHLELDWDEACLSPQRNKRVVKTASVEQVRRPVYRGSSQAWKKFEPFLEGAFDDL